MIDVQQIPPVCDCCRCGQEIYQEDPTVWQAGGLVHVGCLGRIERRAVAPAIDHLQDWRRRTCRR